MSIKTKFGTSNIDSKGYYIITSKKEKNKGKFLHRLIYEDHFGEIPKSCVIHHIDGNKNNNDINNLQCMARSFHIWYHHTGAKRSDETKKNISESKKGKCTGKNHWNYGKHHSEETKMKIGLKSKGRVFSKDARKKIADSHRGENSSSAKLTENDVIDIRKAKKQGFSRKKVFEMLGKPKELSLKGGFDGIWYGRSWKHIKV